MGSVTRHGGVVEERLVETEGDGEVAARGGWRGRPTSMLGPCCPAWLVSTGSGPGVGAMQMLSCSPGGRCLHGVLLSLAKLGHRSSQVEEAGTSAATVSVLSPLMLPTRASSRAVARSWSPLRVRSGIRYHSPRSTAAGRRRARTFQSSARAW